MIFDKSKLILAAIPIAAIGFLGVAGPVFAAELIPTASAQSAAVQSAVDQLSDKASTLSARDKLKGVLEVLMTQIGDLQKSLASLKGLDDGQEGQRNQYLNFLNDASQFITALQIDAETADVKFLAGQLQDWREETFNPEVSRIVDFSLAFQVRSVLTIAEVRYLKIRSDVNRLMDLKILKDNKAQNLLADVQLLLTAAADLRSQAESLMTADGGHDNEIRQLLGASIAKIKLAYKKFLEISQLVKEALK